MLRGLYLTLGTKVDPTVNRDVQAAAARMLERPLSGVTDIVPGYASVYVEFDASRIGPALVERWARTHTEAASEEPSIRGRFVEVPVDYRGLDLADVATRTGLTEADVIARHAAPSYQVFALGFTPGFPYLGLVDPALRLARRSTPRRRVDAHAVAIANAQTGIYPSASPGGWHILGTALIPVYDLHRAEPFLLRPGDTVRFRPAAATAAPPPPRPLTLLPDEPRHPLLEVLEPGFLDLVVDAGRTMMGRFGLARSGPLDAWSAAQANHLAGNRPDAPVIECNLHGPALQATAASVLGFAGWGMQPLLNGRALDAFCQVVVNRGDTITFRPLPFGVRGYLALPGGVASDRFAGSASVDRRAGIGRPLASGDVIGGAAPQPSAPPPKASSASIARLQTDPVVVRIVPGPQATPEALAALQADAFTVRGGDRMGVRLDGRSVPGHDVVSEAVPLGAVQVTPDGAPIILLHDRGTLGGYAKPALIDGRDLPIVGQLAPGRRVVFRVSGGTHTPRLRRPDP